MGLDFRCTPPHPCALKGFAHRTTGHKDYTEGAYSNACEAIN